MNFEPGTFNSERRRAFTLTELLIVIMIIGIMADLALSALSGATELAREQRTRSIINKLDQLIGEKYEEYRTRAVPLRLAAGNQPAFAARMRLYALRDLMRMELPDRATDVMDSTAVLNSSPAVKLLSAPSVWRQYQRQAKRALGTSWQTAWKNSEWESAECLYLIVSTMQDGDKSALDFFLPSEIGDTDGNGMKEILDAWGTPISFLRWAPGYTIENGALTTQTTQNTTVASAGGGNNYYVYSMPDPFDPARADLRWRVGASSSLACFALRPLIFSAGRDKSYGIVLRADSTMDYSTMSIPNDPYYFSTSSSTQVGTPNSGQDHNDNITNHYQETP